MDSNTPEADGTEGQDIVELKMDTELGGGGLEDTDFCEVDSEAMLHSPASSTIPGGSTRRSSLDFEAHSLVSNQKCPGSPDVEKKPYEGKK